MTKSTQVNTVFMGNMRAGPHFMWVSVYCHFSGQRSQIAKLQPAVCSSLIWISIFHPRLEAALETCSHAPLMRLLCRLILVLLSGHQAQPSDTLTQSLSLQSCFARWSAQSQQEKTNINCLSVFLGKVYLLCQTKDPLF